MSDSRRGTTDASRRSFHPGNGPALSRTILDCAHHGLSRTDFLREASQVLMGVSGCDAVELRLADGDVHFRWQASRRPEDVGRFELARWRRHPDGRVIPAAEDDSDLERLCWDVACRPSDPGRTFFTRDGSFWTGNAGEPLRGRPGNGGPETADERWVGGPYRSLAVIRFVVDRDVVGLLLMKSEQPDYFAEEQVEFYEGAAQMLGPALAAWRVEHAVRERVKELTCLYRTSQLAQEANLSLPETLQHIAELLPPAWQYPDNAAACITLDEESYTSTGFRASPVQQSAEIGVEGRRRGAVQVVYLEDRPELAPHPFLPEEDKLLAAVAREVGRIVERKETEREKTQLWQQLVHADRLATIGQLATGVAHELNEPLGSILGFAQLAQKCEGLPKAARQDIEKVIAGALYAREVIRKLMVFARQVPARKVRVNLNEVVEEGLCFLEARCAKADTRVVRQRAPDLPEIEADPSQITQVLVNLVVNAIQAMPQGGTVTVGTRVEAGSVVLAVQDTGIGIPAEVLQKIFLPFFTTKKVSEGTGLGLAVVDGIVASHGGSIEVQSEPGQGTRFEVRLPVAGGKSLGQGHQDVVGG